MQPLPGRAEQLVGAELELPEQWSLVQSNWESWAGSGAAPRIPPCLHGARLPCRHRELHSTLPLRGKNLAVSYLLPVLPPVLIPILLLLYE